jgi:hypothetical protein
MLGGFPMAQYTGEVIVFLTQSPVETISIGLKGLLHEIFTFFLA